MPPEKKPKRSNRSAFIQLRLSAAEKRRFEQAAALDRRTLSDFARIAMDDRAAGLAKDHATKDAARSKG